MYVCVRECGQEVNFVCDCCDAKRSAMFFDCQLDKVNNKETTRYACTLHLTEYRVYCAWRNDYGIKCRKRNVDLFTVSVATCMLGNE